MTLKNFRAVDFKGGVVAAASKRDRAPKIEDEAPKPTDKPIVAPDADVNEVPEGTIPEVLAWVGEDKDRAKKALDKENENSKPRKGLVADLNELLGE